MDFFKMPSFSRSSFEIEAACGCHTGIKRANNEDNFFFHGTYLNSDNHGLNGIDTCSFDIGLKNGEGTYLAVFDGMGGGDYGEVASYTAAKTAKQFTLEEHQIHPYDVTLSLKQLCQEMNDRVFIEGSKLGSSQMGSTVVSLYFYRGYVWLMNLGDSRGYIISNGRMKQISVDHTDEEQMKANGITGRKPYLVQYLGIDPDELQIEPYIASSSMKKDTTFLLCSDGLTDMVSEEDICNIINQYPNPEQCTKVLIQAALDGGGRDNITVMLCRVL